eukprot:scaffold16916_cov84-Attheya_sp.AAC.2
MDLDPRSMRNWDMSTDLRISSTLRKTAREGRLTDTDTDPDPYPYPLTAREGLKAPCRYDRGAIQTVILY